MDRSAVQMVSATPLWVWLLLAVLVVLGLRQTRAQRLSPWRMTMQPAVMGCAAAASATALFGLHFGVAASFLGGLAVGLVFARGAGLRRTFRQLADGRVLVSGSWTPLAIYLVIFTLRYAAAASLSASPSLAESAAFAAAVSALYGLPVGMLLARALRLPGVQRAAVTGEAG